MGLEALLLSASITVVVLFLVIIFLFLFKWKVAFSFKEGEEIFHVTPSGVIDENANSFRKLKKKLSQFEKFQIELSEEVVKKNLEIAQKLIASDGELRSNQERTAQALQAVLLNIKDMREETKILREEIQKQAEELERHKKGYDVDILSTALIPIARMHRVLLSDINNGSISDDAKNTLVVLEDEYLGVLETKGVRLVYPTLGERYRDQKNIQHPPHQVPSEDSESAGKIASVIQPAYELETSVRNVVLLPAEVQIYTYQNEKANNEIEPATINDKEETHG